MMTGIVASGIGVGIAASSDGYFIIDDKYIICKTFTDEGINACIDALGSEGGTVILPEGEYDIDGVITIDQDNTTLQGCGWGTYLNASSWSTDHVVNLNGKDNVIIRDLQIEGQDGGGNTKDLISVPN